MSHKTEHKSELKTYIIINTDLKMGKGKMCGQCGHAVAAITRYMEKHPNTNYRRWIENGETKIVIKASEEEMRNILMKWGKTIRLFPIFDMGLTQIESGSFTALGLEPL